MRTLFLASLLLLATVTVAAPGASACTQGVHALGPDALVSVCLRWSPPQNCFGGVPLWVDTGVGRITDGWLDFCSLWLDVLPA